MLEKIISLKENLKDNWPYIFKILFTFSFYLIYKAFLKVISPEAMKPYILIFVVLGFLVFSIDKWIYPIVDLMRIIYGEKIDKSKKKIALFVFALIFFAFILVLGYYISGYYPIVYIILFLVLLVPSISALSIDFSNSSIRRIIIVTLSILSIIGISGIIYSFYINEFSNRNLFFIIFLLGYFILDYLISTWMKKYSKD